MQKKNDADTCFILIPKKPPIMPSQQVKGCERPRRLVQTKEKAKVNKEAGDEEERAEGGDMSVSPPRDAAALFRSRAYLPDPFSFLSWRFPARLPEAVQRSRGGLETSSLCGGGVGVCEQWPVLPLWLVQEERTQYLCDGAHLACPVHRKSRCRSWFPCPFSLSVPGVRGPRSPGAGYIDFLLRVSWRTFPHPGVAIWF